MSIIGSLPNNLTNGTTADATQVMANFNTIVNGVNANAAAVTSVQNSSYNYAADTGTVNNIIVGMSPSPASYVDGLPGNFRAVNTNTSTSVNIKYGSLGNKALVIDQAGTLPPIGSIISGMHYRTEYDSVQDKVILINPSRSSSSFTISLTAMTATTTGTVNYAVNSDGKTFSVWIGSSITGTSNGTTMQGTGVPSILTTGTGKGYQVTVVDNNSGSNGTIDTGLSTTWTFYKNYSSTGFTNSGVKGLGTAPHFSFVGSTD